MKVSVESITGVSRKVTVEIPASRVDSQFETLYRGLSKQARIKGFRPGKVPRGILKRYFATTVTKDVGDALVNATLEDALLEAALRPVGEISIDTGSVSEGKDFKYDVTFEVIVMPDAIATDGVSVPAEMLAEPTLDPEDVNRRIAELQRKESELVAVEERPSEIGDIVEFDGEATKDGEPFEELSGEHLRVEIGASHLPLGLSDGLLGVQKGDSRLFDIQISADDDEAGDGDAETERGTVTVTLQASIRGVFTLDVPDLDDDFARDLDFESMDAMRAHIEGKAVDEAAKAARDRIGAAAWDAVIAANPIALPESLILEVAADMERSFLARMGVDPDNAPEGLSSLKGMMRGAAERDIKKNLLSAAIARQLDMRVTREEFDAHIASVSARVGVDVAKLRDLMADNAEQRGRIEDSILMDKVTAHLEELARRNATSEGVAASDDKGAEPGGDSSAAATTDNPDDSREDEA
jgi:trigger factor